MRNLVINFQEPVAKKPEPTPELEKNVVEDENGWETAPGKNKKGKMNKGGKGKKPEVKPAEPAPVVQEKKSVAAPKTEPKKEHKKEMSDNSEPVKVEPVEVVKPVEMEPKKESPPLPKVSKFSLNNGEDYDKNCDILFIFHFRRKLRSPHLLPK